MNFESCFSLWRSMLRIRRVEEAIAHRYSEQEMRCPVHLSIGQEAVAVGVCSALGTEDIVYSNHRSHAHYLAKGGDLQALLAELYGKAEGCCGGRGGSMHIADRSVGFWGATPIVAATVPIAVGVAWAAKLQGLSRIVVVFFGDGCFEEGVIHESLNFASLHQLPVLFICENNAYSVYTNLRARQPDRAIYQVAAAHGIKSICADGNNVITVNNSSTDAVLRIKAGKGPQFIEFTTFRWLEHCGPNYDDELGYRELYELSNWKENCPINNAFQEFIQNCNDVNLEEIEEEIYLEIKTAFESAQKGMNPDEENLTEYV